MKPLFSFFLFLLFVSSCHMGRHYANQRAGGKSPEENFYNENSAIINSDSTEKTDFTLARITNVDTLLVKDLPGNKKMIVIKENPVKLKTKPGTEMSKPAIKKVIRKTSSEKEKQLKTSFVTKKKKSPFVKFLKKSFRILIYISLLIFLAFLIVEANSVLLTILIFLIGGILGVAIAGALIIWFLVELAGEIINHSTAFTKQKNHLQSVDHGERIAILFWLFIGVVVIGGLITALLVIPDFWVILLGILGVILAALLAGAVLAALFDFIMPGDSMFSKKKNPVLSFLKKLSLVKFFSN